MCDHPFMSSELRIYLPSPEAPADARRALKILEGIFDVLDKLDSHNRETGQIQWRFTSLEIGSVGACTKVEKPRPDQRWSDAEALLPLFVKGLATAEEHAVIPRGWNFEAARKARTLTKSLGDEKVRLQVIGDLKTSEYTITKRASSNLDVALKSSLETSGSLTGRIESVNFHDGKFQAKLWLDAPRRSITVHFTEKDAEEVRKALRKRVQVSGLISRDRTRRAESIKLRGIRTLREANTSALVSLAGAFPDITGGLEIEEYLEELRGTS